MSHLPETADRESNAGHGARARGPLDERRTHLLLLLVMVLALCLRLVALFNEQTITPDGYYYGALAESIRSGRFDGELSSYWPPLYPFLMAVFSLATGDLELAGRLVSVAAGVLLILPAFFLCRDSFGTRTALVGSCLVATHPLLVYYSVLVLTEATYTLLFTTTLAVGWRALRQSRAPLYFLTGALTGASYLARPEAFWYIVPLGVLTLLREIFLRKESRQTSWLNPGALLLGFLILSGPYLLHLRQTTGHWTMSGKAADHILSSPRYKNQLTGAPQSGLSDRPRPRLVLSRLAQSARRQFQLFNLVFPLPFVLLAGLGLFRKRWSRERALQEGFLIIFLTAATVGYILTVPNIRFVVPLLPIMLRWVAQGVWEFVEWGAETALQVLGWDGGPGKRRAVALLLVMGLAFCLTPLFLYLTRGDKNIDYLGQKKAGLWVRHHSRNPTPVMMALSPLSAFYAGGKYVYLPATSYADALTMATQKEVEFIVVSERDAAGTGLEVLLDLERVPEELCLSQVFGRESNYKVVVYRLKSGSVCQ